MKWKVVPRRRENAKILRKKMWYGPYERVGNNGFVVFFSFGMRLTKYTVQTLFCEMDGNIDLLLTWEKTDEILAFAFFATKSYFACAKPKKGRIEHNITLARRNFSFWFTNTETGDNNIAMGGKHETYLDWS